MSTTVPGLSPSELQQAARDHLWLHFTRMGGYLDGEVLICPLHWWRYDVRSGRRLGRPELAVASYPVRVVDGEVRVKVPPAPPPRSWRELLLEHAREGIPARGGDR